jgi:hypothetical protein
MTSEHDFVSDGAERAAEGLRAAVEAEVEGEYAPRLAEATSRLERMRLRGKMRREIARRTAEQRPPSKDALY